MSSAVARSTDPWTSWAAARAIDVKPSQAAVLWMIDLGYLADSFILEDVEAAASRVHGIDLFSPSRIRTAVKELQDGGYIVDTGATRATLRGKQARILRRAAVDSSDRPLF